MQQIELELAGGGVLTVSLRASLDAMPAVKQRPLVLVVPGGGYNHVSPREGDPATTCAARRVCRLRRRALPPPC